MKKYQSGFSMVEMVMALAIMGVVIAGSARLTEQYMGDTKNQIAAKQLQDVLNASQQYIKDNYAAVVATATAASPATITVATLVSGNYLPSGFSATNAFGQTMETRALEPVANQITAVTVTSGGTTINDIDIGSIAASIGAMGGSVRSTSATTLTGTMGGWSIPLAGYGVTPGAGHLGGAIWFDVNGGVVSDYLYRNAVPGHPEANRMNTVLDMGGFRITALQSIAVIGSECTAPIATGDLAQGPNGEILSCQLGTWKTQGGGGGYWKDPVASYAALPSTGNSTGDTRIVTGLARPAAFTWTGSAWSPLSIDQNGNLSIPGTLSVTGATTLSSVTISGTATIANLAGNLQVTATAVEGAACTGEGRIAASTTTSGLILSCQSGVWKKQTGSGFAGSVILSDTIGKRTITVAQSTLNPVATTCPEATLGAHRYRVALVSGAYYLQWQYCTTNGAGLYYFGHWNDPNYWDQICVLSSLNTCTAVMTPGLSSEWGTMYINSIGVNFSNRDGQPYNNMIIPWE